MNELYMGISLIFVAGILFELEFDFISLAALISGGVLVGHGW
jgi:hypothetical protein